MDSWQQSQTHLLTWSLLTCRWARESRRERHFAAADLYTAWTRCCTGSAHSWLVKWQKKCNKVSAGCPIHACSVEQLTMLHTTLMQMSVCLVGNSVFAAEVWLYWQVVILYQKWLTIKTPYLILSKNKNTVLGESWSISIFYEYLKPMTSKMRAWIFFPHFQLTKMPKTLVKHLRNWAKSWICAHANV